MIASSEFYIDVKKIHIAHEYTLDKTNKCEYKNGRGAYGLVYAVSGCAEYRFTNGERVTVSEGEALLISPNAAYVIITREPFRHYTVNFDVHKETSHFQTYGASHEMLKTKCSEQLEVTFKRLIGTRNEKNAQYEMMSIGILYELIALFYTDYVGKSEKKTNRRLLVAKEYIDRNFDKQITLEKLAYLSDMSVTNFRREWSRRYGVTPLKYRDSLRLQYAKEYLNCGYYSVTEVARRCGFDDVSYFVRFFNKKTGTTPGQYSRGI